MRQQTLLEMHEILNQMLREMDDGGQAHFEIISMARSMSENVQGMIEKLAKLTGDAIINLKSMAMASMGDEAAMKVEHGITQPLNQCADALARLKANLDNLVFELENHEPSDLDGGMGGGMGGDMGGGGMGADDGMGGGSPPMDDGSGAPPPMDDAGGAGNAGAPGAPAAPGGAPAPMAPEMPPERPRKRS